MARREWGGVIGQERGVVGGEVSGTGGAERASAIVAAARAKEGLSKTWVALAVVGAVWVVGQVARDRWLVTAWAFYVPTPVVVLVLAVGMAVAWKRRVWRWLRWLVGLVWVAPVVMFAVVENRWVPRWEAGGAGGLRDGGGASELREARGAGVVRIVHWNVMGGNRGVPSMLNRLVEPGGDLYVLTEGSTGRIRRLLPKWLGAGWWYHQSPAMLVASRWPIVSVEDRVVPSGSVLAMRIEREGREWGVWAVDIASNPLRSRAAACEGFRELLERGPRPAVIVGDFNLPRRSYQLGRVAEGYEHAYHAAGWGWSYSWPMPVPLIAIDQCLVGAGVRVAGYRLVGTGDSDHRMQVIDLGMEMIETRRARPGGYGDVERYGDKRIESGRRKEDWRVVGEGKR